jgi:hypothetical protein
VERVDAARNAHREHAALVQPLSDLVVVEAHIATHRVKGQLACGSEAIDGGLRPLDQRFDLAGVSGIALGEVNGEDAPNGGCRDQARFAATLRRAIALALDNGSA